MKVIVLVGEQLKFDTYLDGKIKDFDVSIAFNTIELMRLMDIQSCHNVIIESFPESEYESLRMVISGYRNNGYNFYFYIPDNEPEICGLADELDMDIYLYLDDIHRDMERAIGGSV